MKAVILCGGMGTRLRQETELRPKPMVEIGQRPIVWHIMKSYAHHGISDFVLCLGYKGSQIKDYFLNYEAMNCDFSLRLGDTSSIEVHRAEGRGHDEADWSVTLADTGQHAMTGARVKRVKRYVGNERFMLTYGDGVSDVDIRALLAFHESHGKVGTLTGVAPPGRFGELALDDKRVRTFKEKPKGGALINGGYFVFEPEFFDYLSDDEGCVLERGPLEKLAENGELMVHEHDGFWQCMDTYRDLKLLRDLDENGKAPWKKWI